MTEKNWFQRVLECPDCEFAEDGSWVRHCKRHYDELKNTHMEALE